MYVVLTKNLDENNSIKIFKGNHIQKKRYMLKLDLQVIVTSNIFFMKTFEIEISSHQLQLITFSLERATKQVFFKQCLLILCHGVLMFCTLM